MNSFLVELRRTDDTVEKTPEDERPPTVPVPKAVRCLRTPTCTDAPLQPCLQPQTLKTLEMIPHASVLSNVVLLSCSWAVVELLVNCHCSSAWQTPVAYLALQAVVASGLWDLLPGGRPTSPYGEYTPRSMQGASSACVLFLVAPHPPLCWT